MAARSPIPANSPGHSPLSMIETGGDGTAYVSGVCNIGPAEIAQRRAFGHGGLAVSIVLLGLLLVLHAPVWTRLFLIIPAGASATGYLQARLHFCAGFGSRGVYNFGAVGTENAIANAEDRARDRRRSLEIGLASGLIGLLVAVAACFLPL